MCGHTYDMPHKHTKSKWTTEYLSGRHACLLAGSFDSYSLNFVYVCSSVCLCVSVSGVFIYASLLLIECVSWIVFVWVYVCMSVWAAVISVYWFCSMPHAVYKTFKIPCIGLWFHFFFFFYQWISAFVIKQTKGHYCSSFCSCPTYI